MSWSISDESLRSGDFDKQLEQSVTGSGLDSLLSSINNTSAVHYFPPIAPCQSETRALAKCKKQRKNDCTLIQNQLADCTRALYRLSKTILPPNTCEKQFADYFTTPLDTQEDIETSFNYLLSMHRCVSKYMSDNKL